MPTRQPVAGIGNVLVECFTIRITTRAESCTSLTGESVGAMVAMLDELGPAVRRSTFYSRMCAVRGGATALLSCSTKSARSRPQRPSPKFRSHVGGARRDTRRCSAEPPTA